MTEAADPQELRRDFFDEHPDMLGVVDREGRVILANRAWEEALGPAAGARMTELVPEGQQGWLLEAFGGPAPHAWSGSIRTAAGAEERFRLSWRADARGLLHMEAHRCSEADGEADAHRRALEERNFLLYSVLANGPLILWTADREGTFTFSAGHALRHLGLMDGEVVGMNLFELYRDYPAVCAATRETLGGSSISYLAQVGERHWHTHMNPIRSVDGEVIGVLGLSIDVTEQARLEQELREHIGLLEQQRDTIRALSTPILQVWDGVLALPVVGHVDEERAEAIMDALLHEVARTGSCHAILDVTGVEVLDTTTVHHLTKMLRAVRLLGSEGILTGVRPGVAQSLVGLGVDLSEVPTLRNLQAGLERCLKAVRRAR